MCNWCNGRTELRNICHYVRGNRNGETIRAVYRTREASASERRGEKGARIEFSSSHGSIWSVYVRRKLTSQYEWELLASSVWLGLIGLHGLDHVSVMLIRFMRSENISCTSISRLLSHNSIASEIYFLNHIRKHLTAEAMNKRFT